MPIFEYKCAEGHTFDRLLSHAQASNTCPLPCEKCDGFATRQVSGPAVHFKGDWFKTKGSY